MANFYYCAGALLGPGSIVLPGNWGRMLRVGGQRHDRYPREHLLEEVRLEEFPHLPSRLESIFLFDNEPNARRWREATGNRYLDVLYEVELIQPTARTGRLAIARLDGFNNGWPPEIARPWARRYWQPPQMGEVVEVLVESPVRIVRTLPGPPPLAQW